MNGPRLLDRRCVRIIMGERRDTTYVDIGVGITSE